MPNCTANQSIPKWADSISLCAWPNTRDIMLGLRQWLIIHNLPLHPSFEPVNTQWQELYVLPDKEWQQENTAEAAVKEKELSCKRAEL